MQDWLDICLYNFNPVIGNVVYMDIFTLPAASTWAMLQGKRRQPCLQDLAYVLARGKFINFQEYNMGLFSFIKDAGEKIFGGKEAKAEELKKNLDAQGLDTQDIQVHVDGDQVVLKGSVKDQETLEKAILAVGNNAGISGVKTDDIKVSAPGGESVFYTVKSGDTLWKIAETQYGKGNGGKYTIIFEANKPMLKDPDKIYPGQNLRIPPLK